MALKKVAIHTGPLYGRDELFNPASPLNRDNCLASFRELKAKLESAACDCHTFDVYQAAPDTVLFLDIPAAPLRKLLGGAYDSTFKCLLLQEPEIIIPRNWELPLQAQFDRIFTWNDELVDGRRYFKFNYGMALPASIPRDLARKEKLCTLIAGNCKSGQPHELYSKRVEAIRWFEAEHPEDFDFYGRGWDEYLFTGPRLWRALNRVKPLARLLAPAFPSYKGPAGSKQELLEKRRFAICYENSSGMPGYISEKIFDCFSAGCLPVYWGAPNIKDHIPADCYLDKREFRTYGELYARMKTMSDTEYLARLSAIGAFIKGEQGRRFSVEYFAETIAGGLLSRS